MKQYQQTEEGSFTIDGMSIPNDNNNRHCRQLQLELSKGIAEIIPFDHEAKVAKETVAAEIDWCAAELKRSDIEFNKCVDGHVRKTGTQTVWKAYRNALRDYIQGGEVMSIRPVAPDA